MSGVAWLLVVAAVLGVVMSWAFRVLPREEWQFIASVPRKKTASGAWTGVNLTFYGFFTATAYVLAGGTFLFLTGSVGVPLVEGLLLLTLLFALCVPASRWIALVVDKTTSGFTVGGAAFVGLLGLPVAVWTLNVVAANNSILRFTVSPVPSAPAFAAVTIAYCFGESFGRLACISFGCCYGKPLAEAGPLAVRLFREFHFVFHGHSKKVAYASGLDGVKLVPIQAVTAVLYSLTGMVGAALFFSSRFVAAFLLTTVVSQGWRAYSETLRADYRGEGRLTVYQLMSMAAVPFAVCVGFWAPASSAIVPIIALGFATIWDPLAFLSLQAVWVAMFLMTGVSETTGAVVAFHVMRGFRKKAAAAAAAPRQRLQETSEHALIGR